MYGTDHGKLEDKCGYNLPRVVVTESEQECVTDPWRIALVIEFT